MRAQSMAWFGLAVLALPLGVGCGGDSETQTASNGAGASSSSGAGGSGGSGGAGGMGGSGGGGPTCAPEGPFDGAAIKPIDAPPGDWTWIPVDGAVCRDGSGTGFGVRPSATGSDKLVIYLEGGGACFNGTTCGINPGSFGSAAFTAWTRTSSTSAEASCCRSATSTRCAWPASS